ncbi:MAG: trigger factor [Oscillospiraceae bacterium]|nr:trigger factor [Oscillospiraceae bacterium]
MSFTYRGLKATLEKHIVTGEEIDRQMERLRQQTPRIAVIDNRPTENGDEIVLDYAGFCDGVQFPGGTAEMQTLVLGSGSFIPGFEEQLLDKVPGEEVVVKVMFPSQYHAAELAGKAAEFRCKIHQIRVKTEYQLDDTFAKEVGGCETFGEMRVKLGQSLQAYTDDRGEMDLQDRLLRQAAETMDFTPSEKQIDAEVDEQLNNLKAQLAQQGLTLEMYCQFMSTTEEKLREDARGNAEASVRIQAAIEQIVYLENLEATEQEMGEALAVIARQNNMTVEQLKPYVDAEFQAAVVRSVLTTKAMKLVRDNAEITETTDEK